MEQTNNTEESASSSNIQIKHPKRILHFSDGTMEEYSDSEEENDEKQETEKQMDVVDCNKLTWGPWLLHKTLRTGYATLSAFDYVGEALASFLGITTPKYQYELDEYRKLEKERAKAAQDEENARGWLNKTENNANGTAVESEQTANNV